MGMLYSFNALKLTITNKRFWNSFWKLFISTEPIIFPNWIFLVVYFCVHQQTGQTVWSSDDVCVSNTEAYIFKTFLLWQNYILYNSCTDNSNTPFSWEHFSNISTIHTLGKIMKHLLLFIALLRMFLVCLLTDVFWQCLFWSFVDLFAENRRIWCKSSSARTQ